MDQKADTTNTEIAKAGIAAAEAEGTPGVVAAPAESSAAEAAKTAPENPFANEDAELAKLEAQVKAEAEAAGKAPDAGSTAADGTGTAPKSGTAATEGAPAPAVADATAAAAAAGHNASTAAIVALRKKNQEIATANLVLQGENRVLKTLVDPEKFSGEAGEAGQPAVEQTPDEEFAALAAERIRIAEEVDGGRMTMREYAEQTNQIQARERAISIAAAEAAIANAQPANDLGLQEHVTTLIQKYPILNTMTAAQLKPFEQIAYEQAEMEGKPIQRGTAIGTRDLRERMGALATQVYGKPAAAGTAAGGNGAGTGAATGSTVTAQPTAAEREAKLVLAGNHPPNIGNTGSGATGGEPTEAQASAALAQGEDAAIRWLEANPGFVQKQMGKSVRLTR